MPVTVVTASRYGSGVQLDQTESAAHNRSELCTPWEENLSAFTPPPLPSDDKRWKIVNGTMRKNGFARHALIETLHTVQSSFGYLDDDAIKFVARSLRVPLSKAYGVVTFYHYFSLKPPGKHTMTICTGTACYIKGTDKLVASAEKKLCIPHGQTTTDGKISLMTARCVGACGRAPVVLADGELQGQMSDAQMLDQLERWAVE
jgi:bidirectional [NiFe] hydrogenase diaphorase subunit